MSELPVLTHSVDMPSTTIVGRYLLRRYRNRVAEAGPARPFMLTGAGSVARSLRKQGIPLAVARVIIFGRA